MFGSSRVASSFSSLRTKLRERQRRQRQTILVFGSCLLDVFADYSSDPKNYLEKIGKLSFAIGGTAFNIAINLAVSGASPSIFTVLKRNSPISDAILLKLDEFGVRSKEIRFSDSHDEGGFIAHRENGRLINAVFSTLIDEINLSLAQAKKLVAPYNVTIVDCTTPTDVIVNLALACFEAKKALVISAVSDAKVERVLSISGITNQRSVELISMSASEARRLNIDLGKVRSEQLYRNGLMERLRTKELCITLGPEGLFYMHADGDLIFIDAPQVPEIVSRSGAGDAVLSAIVDWKYMGNPAKRDIVATVTRYVIVVLGEIGSTIAARTDTDRFVIMRRRSSFIVRFGQNTLIFNYLALIAFIATLVGLWFSLPPSWKALAPW